MARADRTRALRVTAWATTLVACSASCNAIVVPAPSECTGDCPDAARRDVATEDTDDIFIEDSWTFDTADPVDTAVTVDTGLPATDAGIVDPVPATPIKISLVHAASGMGVPIKVCLHNSLIGWLASIDVPMPATGLSFAAGGRLDLPASFAPALPHAAITLYVVPSTFDTMGRKCSEMLPGTAMFPPAPPPGIVRMPTIPRGTFAASKSYVVALTGCGDGQGNDAAARAKCGPTYVGTQNWNATAIQVDNVTSASEFMMGAQFIHLSPQLQSATPSGVHASFGTAGTSLDLAGPVLYREPPTVDPATALLFGGLSFARPDARLDIAAATAGGTKGPTLMTFDLAAIEFATTGMTTPYLRNGRRWTFIGIGDPAAMGPTSFRVIALPSD